MRGGIFFLYAINTKVDMRIILEGRHYKKKKHKTFQNSFHIIIKLMSHINNFLYLKIVISHKNATSAYM